MALTVCFADSEKPRVQSMLCAGLFDGLFWHLPAIGSDGAACLQGGCPGSPSIRVVRPVR